MMRLLKPVLALIIVGMAMAASTAAFAQTTDQTLEWRFDVFLDKKPIGAHDYRVTVDGNSRQVESRARFDVKFLFVNAYSYRHQMTEQWDADCLTGINAYTDANGKESTIKGRINSDGLIVDAGDSKAQLNACVMSFAYWNPGILNAQKLLNAQTGEYEAVAVSVAGEETLSINDDRVSAVRYDIEVNGKTISVWYGASNNRWLALEAPAKGKRTLRYVATQVPTAEKFAFMMSPPAIADAD